MKLLLISGRSVPVRVWMRSACVPQLVHVFGEGFTTHKGEIQAGSMVFQVYLQDAPRPGAVRQGMSSEVRPHIRANLVYKDALGYATRCLQTLVPGASHSLSS
jgi:hypothetical protein